MKNLSSWLIAMFMFMFWAFRVVVSFMEQYGKDFGGFTTFNFTIEIVLLFLTMVCIALFLRRNIFGGILYLATYGYYFGSYIFSSLMQEGEMNMIVMQNIMVSAVGIIIAFFAFLDLFIQRARKKDPKDKKTDWFFKDGKYERDYDERADRNEYRNY